VVSPLASLRVSGATLNGGVSIYDCVPPAAPVFGPFVQATPADPTLTLSGSALPGQTIWLTAHGTPGSSALLMLGRRIGVFDVANVEEDSLTNPLWRADFGALDASGQAALPFTLPASMPRGTVLVFQARTTDAG